MTIPNVAPGDYFVWVIADVNSTANQSDETNDKAQVGFSVVVPPVITGISPTSGPVGTLVTITGENFGDTRNFGTVMFDSTLAPVFLGDWSDTQIVATVPSSLSPDNYDIVVTADGVMTNAVSFSVIALPAPNVDLFPSRLDFGEYIIDTISPDQTVTLSNRGDADLVIGVLNLEGDNLQNYAFTSNTCDGVTLVPGASCSFSAWFAPIENGLLIASVSVPSNADGSPHTVPLSGTGVFPDLCSDRKFSVGDCKYVNKLRHVDYFNISHSTVSDEDLLEYVKNHKDSIQALLFQIDYGRTIEDFITGGSEIDLGKELLRNLVPDLLDILEFVAEFLSRADPAYTITSSSLSTFAIIIEGIKVYKKGIKVISREITQRSLQEYINQRRHGISREIAWKEISNFYGDLLIRISARTKIPVDELVWLFENAFVAHSLATTPDIRYSQGEALARLILPE